MKKLTEQQIIEFFAKNDISLISEHIELDKNNLNIAIPTDSMKGYLFEELSKFFNSWSFELYFQEADDDLVFFDDFDDCANPMFVFTIPRKFVDLEVK